MGTINNWTEVNELMKQLGKLNITVQKFEGAATVRINEVKAYYKEKSEPSLKEIKNIEAKIKEFAARNKSEFVKKRTKNLTNGAVSYRRTKKAVCSYTESAISALKELNLTQCIRVKEELNKDELLKCDPSILAKAGISIVEEDKIKIEPDYVKLENDDEVEDDERRN